MHIILFLLMTFRLLNAHPRPQEVIDVEAMLANYDAATPTMTEAVAAAMTHSPALLQYDQEAAITAAIEDAATAITTPASSPTSPSFDIDMARRAATCNSQAVGYGPNPIVDTPEAFVIDSTMSSIATSAPTVIGSYSRSFVNLNGSNEQLGYLTYITLKSYDIPGCSLRCDSISQCLGFNIYFERSPSVNPNDISCANPPSTTLIKCALYGYPVYAATATNTGQYRNKFHVVITGSTGYSKLSLPAAPTGFTNATAYLGAIRSYQPTDVKYITYRGYTGPVDVSVCAAACNAVTVNNRGHAYPKNATSYDACNFFNVWIGVRSDVPIGWTCSMYVGPPGRVGMDDNYGQGKLKVVNSIGYTADLMDPGVF